MMVGKFKWLSLAACVAVLLGVVPGAAMPVVLAQEPLSPEPLAIV